MKTKQYAMSIESRELYFYILSFNPFTPIDPLSGRYDVPTLKEYNSRAEPN